MLLVDENAALAAIPSMLPSALEKRANAFDVIKQVLGARGELSSEDKERLQKVAQLFGLDDDGDFLSRRLNKRYAS